MAQPPPGYPGYGPPPGQGYPAQGQGQGYPVKGQGYPAHGQGYPAPGQGYPVQGQGYPAPGQAYPGQSQGYPAQGQGYPAQGQGYPGPPPSYHQAGYQQPTAPAYPPPAGHPGGYPGAGMPPQHYPPPQGQGYPAAGAPGYAAPGYPGQPPVPAGEFKIEDHVIMTADIEFDLSQSPESKQNADKKRKFNEIIRSKKPSIVCTQECPPHFLDDSNMRNGYVQDFRDGALPGKFVYNRQQVMVVYDHGPKRAEDIIKEELGDDAPGLCAHLFRSTHPEHPEFELLVVNWHGAWNGDQRKLSNKKKMDQLGALWDAITNVKKHERFRTVPIVVGGNFTFKYHKWDTHAEVSYWDYVPSPKCDKRVLDMIITSKDIYLWNVQAVSMPREDTRLFSHDIVFGRVGNILDPLPFHEFHGKSISLDVHNEIAYREVKKDDRAYVFSSRPLKLGESFNIQIYDYDGKGKGNLFYGLTSIDPQDLQQGDLPDPDELDEDDSGEFMVQSMVEYAEDDDEISIHLSPTGVVRHSIARDPEEETDDSAKDSVDPEIDWWVYFNVVGKTKAIRSLGSFMVDEECEKRWAEEDHQEWYSDDEYDEEYSDEEYYDKRSRKGWRR